MVGDPIPVDYVPDYEDCVLPYVQWYQDDFVGGVRGMRAHEIGVYTMLLMEMYARGKALDLSESRLARLCGIDKRAFATILQMLIDEGKIIRLACGLWNDRCENAFKSRAKMLKTNSEAGKASAGKRNKIKGAPERPFNERSTVVQPSSEAQKEKEETNVSSKKQGSRLPEDWTLPKAWDDLAVEQGLSEFEIKREAVKFRNYWVGVAGQKGVKRDWKGTWQNWVIKALEDRQKRPGARAVRNAHGDLTNAFLFSRG
ncbi:DUF1376 domain-containing protein [Aminobacter sp. P9b]|uniref:YdaU family protein n=1 Tax=Aminobacter sp. P9b TaxID=3133697 RepID=UPI00324F3E67